MKRFLTVTLAAAMVLAMAGCGGSADATYMNPVFSPVFADPCIIRGDDGYFYAYATEDYGCFGEEDKVACVPIIKSPDMVKWEYVGDVFSEENKPDWGDSTAGAWAPDIIKIGDKYNLYYSLSVWNDKNPGIGVAVADHPAGPWTDKGMVLNTQTSGVKNSIDSFTFEYEGGVYMIWELLRHLYGRADKRRVAGKGYGDEIADRRHRRLLCIRRFVYDRARWHILSVPFARTLLSGNRQYILRKRGKIIFAVWTVGRP